MSLSTRSVFGLAFVAFGSLVACSPSPPPTTAPVAPARSPASAPAPALASAPASASYPSPTPSPYVQALRAKLGGAPLTLDPRLQAVTEQALADVGKAGAMVVMEPDTGTVRAVYSVAGDRGDPLLVAHMPASAFKPFAAIAGLEAGKLTRETEKECAGTFPFRGKVLRCASVHGKETTAQAISRSCNSFFYSMATEVEHGRVLEVARRFGFGERTGIELEDEAGTVPGAARERELARDPSSTVPLLDAIGHGEIHVTLLQFARAYAAVANGGKILRLGVTRGGSVERSIRIRPGDLELVSEALVDVVEAADGTAHAFAIPGFRYAGKTGTGEAPPKGGVEADDAWFIAYAPPSNAKILVAARVERADPARDAKGAVKKVLEAWRAGK